jgi:hypothetical protein
LTANKLRDVAVLFVRADSVYKMLAGCDVWDIERDARRWPGVGTCSSPPSVQGMGEIAPICKTKAGRKRIGDTSSCSCAQIWRRP